MINDNNEALEKEDLIKKLMALVFKKAKKNSREPKIYGISKYLNFELNEEINDRTLTRYYNKYLESKEEKTTPTDYNLDVLSIYLGYKNFKDFEVRREYVNVITSLKKRIVKMQKIGSFSIFILVILSVVFSAKYYKKNCMIWVDDHYEKIRCSGLDMEDSLDPVRLEKFKKVEVCMDSVFFKNGEPIKHYLKHNNEIEFFTYSGEHPIYKGKFLNEVTPTIITNNVKPCDFIAKTP